MEKDTGKPTRHVGVCKFRILKPAGDMKWKELGALLRDTRYRTFRLANMAIAERFHAFYLWTQQEKDSKEKIKSAGVGELNQRLRKSLVQDGKWSEEELSRFSRAGAVPANITDALSQYKLRSVMAKSKWMQVLKGQAHLPSFKLTMPIPIRCDKDSQPKLERTEAGNMELDLAICLKPYPRVVLATHRIGDSAIAILNRLLDNPDQLEDGYRQRCFEVRFNERDRRWYLYVTYDFPAKQDAKLNPDVIVGVDVGWDCPLFVALNNGHARLGHREFGTAGARIRSLQRQTIARRRSMQNGGRIGFSSFSRSGHGRKRKLLPISKLHGRIDDAYSTLNHQMSADVVRFARNHGAGTIRLEDLSGLQKALTGTFIGQRWRYRQLQRDIQYKAAREGIVVEMVNPARTSQRCSECGWIHAEFDGKFRMEYRRRHKKAARFECPNCEYKADADYNAARNLAVKDIEKLIHWQCKAQKLPHSSSEDEAL